MSQSKGTPFGCQANVEAGSGGTALPSPRARSTTKGISPCFRPRGDGRAVPPESFATFAWHPKGVPFDCEFLNFIHVAIEGYPLWMPSERRGGLGRNRSTVSSRPEARGTPFGGASKRPRGSRKQPFLNFIHVAIEGYPLWMPSERRE